jgi:hypothetical protein
MPGTQNFHKGMVFKTELRRFQKTQTHHQTMHQRLGGAHQPPLGVGRGRCGTARLGDAGLWEICRCRAIF